MSRPRILLADDHRLFIDGLKRLLAPEFEVVGTVEDGKEILKAVELLNPDVLVIDISMPNLNGLEAARGVHQVHKEVKIVFLTMHTEVAYAVNAFQAGASGYVLKHAASEELIHAIKEVFKGRTFISSLIAGELVQAYQNGNQQKAVTFENLTSRQREVLRLLVAGHTSKEIASALGVSAKNVEYHKYKIMELLGIKTSAELILYALHHGIIPFSSPPHGNHNVQPKLS